MSHEAPGCILAADYGRKRIGLALSDTLCLTAQPLTTLMRTNREKDLARLRDICRKNAVRLIIVGHPLHLTGEAGEMADEAARFANRLNKNLGIPVELVDERLTTWEARETVRRNNSSRPPRPLDEVAAAILLREYLERGRAQAPASAIGEAR
ncbi:MAG: Holliday junction resolvase RuvX [Candidatus Acidiferrales bacterium]|jgi:putative Holliday junction resolvase